MGGDAQPQVVLQLLARLLRSGQSPQTAIVAPRWRLEGVSGRDPFDTWTDGGRVRVVLESAAAELWSTGLSGRGHEVVSDAVSSHGHAHMIEVGPNGQSRGAADPRAPEAAAVP